MLEPRFKSLHIISSFVGQEQGVSFIEEYDKKFLYLMLVKCYEDLHPLIRSYINIMLTKIFLIEIEVWTFFSKLQIQAN
jgi:hypothetical protein